MRPTTFDPGQVNAGNQLAALGELLPYLWPRGEPGLRVRARPWARGRALWPGAKGLKAWSFLNLT